MGTTPTVQMPGVPAASSGPERAVAILREALERQALSDSTIDVDSVIDFAMKHPTESVVDSFASVEVLCSIDEVFGDLLPRELLSHDSLTTLRGLRNCVKVLAARKPKKG